MSNHLAGETSPYLRQHADNPVDWYPWGEQALTLARELNKPILLSIGYSACHWCHVMAHESFEDTATATAMNAHFVNIKVDREERPDLDQVYQSVHAMLTHRSGGWPLTVFLASDRTPFFAGTYFPKEARYGLPGFGELVVRAADFHHEHAGEIAEQKRSLVEALEASLPRQPSTTSMNAKPLAIASDGLGASFDREWGGFGDAPKFPRPVDLELCLRRYDSEGDTTALEMVRVSLLKMAEGGIYDHVGGGFFRYSVDRMWRIPHFEKMLYDNGPLLALYSDAWLLTGEVRFREVVEQSVAWVLREMRAPEGGFFSSLDADSDNAEGGFYVWTKEQIQALLTASEYRIVERCYGLDQPANFEDRFWHLTAARDLGKAASALGLGRPEASPLLDSARGKLFSARELRPRPHRDEKILTSWNALMIKGLLRAARVFRREDWLVAAQAAMDFIRTHMWLEGRLFASRTNGSTRLNAYLDDHAFLLDALLEAMQTRFRPEDLAFARELAEVLLQRFEDRELGGFYFTSHDHEQLFHRPKPCHDNATPAGNGVAAHALQRLGHAIGEPRYLRAAERALRLFHPAYESRPEGFGSLLFALEEFLTPPAMVVIRGPESGVRRWENALASCFRPHTMVFAIAGASSDLPGTLVKPFTTQVNAWVCDSVKCSEPVDDWVELRKFCKGGEFV